MIFNLLGIEDLSFDQFRALIESSRSFVEVSTRDLKKVPALRGKTIINLFLEPSTRTRTSFEIAGKRLSADVINISEGSSSVVKGETLLDTAQTLQAMAPEILVLRHKESGSAHFIAKHLKTTAVINGGDGMHEHPTQALLDCLSLSEYFSKTRGAGLVDALKDLTVAIVGDIRHSRVARSNIWAHLLLGNKIRLVGPPTFVPPELGREETWDGRARGNISVHHNLAEGLEGADVVMCLRLQLERQDDGFIPSLQEYTNEFCITERVLSRYAPKSVVLHPGPVNRGTEVSTEVIDGPRSLVANQVTHGVAVRMAALFAAATPSRAPISAGGEG